MERMLTARQQRFVHHYLANGGKGVEAAVSAGYSEASAASIASKELRKQHVQQAVGRATLEAIGLYAVPALHRIVKLAASAKSDYVQLEAAKDLLNRAGFAPPQRVDHRLDHALTVSFDLGGSKTVISRTSDPTDTGKSPAKLEPADIIDVFPTEVPDPSASSE